MALFDSKNFNPEVFGAYVEKTPNLKRNELIRSKAIKRRQDLAASMKEQTGTNYITTPIFGRIGGAAQNYDGKTDLTATSMGTFTQGRVVVGRMNMWEEADFSYDITGGVDFLAQAATQIGEYWDGIDQQTLLSTLKGIFSMTGTENLKFVNGHTYDISGNAGAEGCFGATTLNTAMQLALGDNKSKFSLAIMHSAVATGLENLKLLSYLKYTDAQGIQRDLSIGTLNGRTVLIDDGMPVEEIAASGDDPAYTKYTTYVLGDGAIEYTDCGAKTPYEIARDPKKNGGIDMLISRQRKVFSPCGISFTDSSIISPSDAQLENGAKWSLANSNESTKVYYPHKAIPIARIFSRG